MKIKKLHSLTLGVGLALSVALAAQAGSGAPGPQTIYSGRLKPGAPHGLQSFRILTSEEGHKILEVAGSGGSCRYELSEFSDATRAVVHSVRFSGSKASCKLAEARKYVSGDFSLQRPTDPGTLEFYDSSDAKDLSPLETVESGG